MSETPPIHAFTPTKTGAHITRDDEVPISDPINGKVADRILVKEWRNDQTNALSYFLWRYETADDNGNWQPVWEIDSSHGTVHEHTYERRNGENKKGEPKAIRECQTIVELEVASDEASSMMFDGWKKKRDAYYHRRGPRSSRRRSRGL